jgi:hypothetical protein
MRRRSLVRLVLAAGGAVVLPPVQAQADWRRVAVPAYTPPAFVQGLLKHGYAPRADEFVQAATRLADTLAQACAAGASARAARPAWRDALLAWVRLSAVAIGPLVERRSVRRIDFLPTRPEQIDAAIARQPQGEADMDRIGSAAKGFGALEWLLWSPAAPATPPACLYAAQLAQEIAREAAALDAGFAAARDRERDENDVVAAMSEALNQWIGGLEQLRLQGIERPLHDARTRGRSRAAFARALSGASAAERAARWQTLRGLAVFAGRAAPAADEQLSPGRSEDSCAPPRGVGAVPCGRGPTYNGLVPLETYLRGKGLNPLADRLRAAAAQAGAALEAAAGAEPARLTSAARRLAGLKTLVEAEVAPALDVRVGFSDADGD